jgi:thiol:disulfide interchange protein DsbD
MLKYIFIAFIFFSSHLHALSPPSADEVFKLNVHVQDPNTLLLTWDIKPGFFLYQKKIKVSTQQPEAQIAQILPIKHPKTNSKKTQNNKTVFIYRNKLQIPVNLIDHQPGEMTVMIHAQGCSDDGFCYPPKTTPVNLTFDKNLALVGANIDTLVEEISAEEHDTFKKIFNHPFENHSWIITLLIFLSLGLLLSFTPCVLPMIPILSGIIIGQGKKISTQKAFFLSLSYVLSMACTYGLIGAIVAKLGQNLQVILQTSWAIYSLSFIFVLLALSMFGLYELTLPLSWQAAITRLIYHQARGQYWGAAIMGCLSTLILSPCVTAPLIGALGYIAQTGDLFLGVSCLFATGFGMGLPLLLIGSSLGRWLPHAGPWMRHIKTIFGILLLGIAIQLVARVTPTWTWVNSEINPETHIIKVTQFTEAEAIIKQATQHGKPVIIDFYADWCANCKTIESKIHNNPNVMSALEGFVVIKADITKNNTETQSLSHKFGVIAPPTFVFINTQGQIMDKLQLVGDISMNELLHALKNTP